MRTRSEKPENIGSQASGRFANSHDVTPVARRRARPSRLPQPPTHTSTVTPHGNLSDDILDVLALAFEPISRTTLLHVLNSAGSRTASGAKRKSTAVAPAVKVLLRAGKIEEIGQRSAGESAPMLDIEGLWLLPPISSRVQPPPQTGVKAHLPWLSNPGHAHLHPVFQISLDRLAALVSGDGIASGLPPEAGAHPIALLLLWRSNRSDARARRRR